jgi:hypothetical protein
MKWEGHVAHMDRIRNTYKILVGKPEKRLLVRPGHRQENNLEVISLAKDNLDPWSY